MTPSLESPKTAILVAHGSPSDPDPQEAALQELASRVQDGLSGWRIGSATLAAKGRLEEEVAALGAPLVYPFFMAKGWFTGQVLAKKARSMGLTMLEPFGVEPDLVTSAATELRAMLAAKGWDPQDTALIVAAHGSAVSKTSADSAYAFARALNSGLGFRSTRTGFIEQPPFLKDIAQGAGQAICLPYFAQNSGHMEDDVPASLSAAGFDGPVMDPFILWSDTARLIGASIVRQSPKIPAEVG